MNEEKYYAVTRKGQFITADSLDAVKSQINNPDDVEMFVYSYRNESDVYTAISGNQYCRKQFIIIDGDGHPTTYKRGNYIVKRIYPDKCSYMFEGRIVVFLKVDTNEKVAVNILPDEEYRVDNIQQFYYSLTDKMDEMTEKDEQQKMEGQGEN